MFDAVIIGSGIIGAMCARELSKYELKICILEKADDVAVGATAANSAIVHAGFDAECGTLKAKLNVKGSKMMQKICRELGVKYKNNGSLVIGFNSENEKTISDLYKRGNKNGVEGLEIIGKKKLKELEPNISDNAICALYAPTGAIVCPYGLAISAIGNAINNGAVLKTGFEVTNIVKDENSYIISSENESIETKTVINAAGLYSDKIAAMIGDKSFSITPRRGEYILFDKDVGNTVTHTIFRTPTEMGKGILISPTVDGNLLTGPTSENISDKDDKSTTQKGFDLILKQVKENINSSIFNKTITSFCGLRAVGSTGDFIIDSPEKGFINAAGIESPGLSASPAIAEYIKDMLISQGYILKEKESFDPHFKSFHWFSELTQEEKNEIIKKDPTFGRIVCRCEKITEGEILDAVRRDPKPTNLDGVKRRTRAQMGRCQGGFCMPSIVEILAKELDKKYTDITKSGEGSYINISKTKEEIK